MKTSSQLTLTAVLALLTSSIVVAQPEKYPKEIRGYKVERTAVEMKLPDKTHRIEVDGVESNPEVDQLITFGAAHLARITPLGITFEVPIVVAPVKQSG